MGKIALSGAEALKNEVPKQEKRLKPQICVFIDLQPPFFGEQAQIGVSGEKDVLG